VVVTWNIHRCIGSDGRHDPGRVLRVLAELDADVLALQEVSARRGGRGDIDQFRLLARSTGMRALEGATFRRRRAHYGNVLLTRLPARRVDRLDLTRPGREPRGAIDAVLEGPAGPLRVVATHLGLRRRERRAQARYLAGRLEAAPEPLVLLLGDLNSPLGRSVGALRRAVGRLRGPRSFPARRPLLRLDRVAARPDGALRCVAAHTSPTARIASDHLPVRALLDPRAGHAAAAGRDALGRAGRGDP